MRSSWPHRTFTVGLVLTLGMAPALESQIARSIPQIVSTVWLEDRLDDPSIVIVHVANERQYAAAHIPGARLLAWEAFTERQGRLYAELPAAETLRQALESIGVSNESSIVLYSPRGHPTAAGRLYVTLAYLGLAHRTAMLDGGLDLWRAEGRPVTTEMPAVVRGTLDVQPRDDVVVHFDWMRARFEDPTLAVLDARTDEFYTGAAGVTMHAARPGHIPGAGNVPFTSLTDESGRFRDEATLRRMLTVAGATPGKRVVTYCHLGMQASLLYFVADYLGYDARLYDGSFEDWSGRPEPPVERSPETRQQ